MSSGVLDALQRLQPDAIEAAAAGFRFFGLERQATFIISAAERARSEPESDEMEAELDRLHDEVGSDDEILLRKFQERFAEDRSAFASPT